MDGNENDGTPTEDDGISATVSNNRLQLNLSMLNVFEKSLHEDARNTGVVDNDAIVNYNSGYDGEMTVRKVTAREIKNK